MFKTELQKVNRFYHEKETTMVKQLAALESFVLGDDFPMQELAQFCRSLELLRYYVVLNYIAVYKIIKKRNKMLKNTSTPLDYLSILLEQPFYTSIKLAKVTVKTELLGLKIMPGETVNEKNFACPICLDVLCNPVVLSCTHRFCWTCLSKTSERMQACPICLKDQQLDPQNFHIDWLLTEFLNKQFPEQKHHDLHSNSSLQEQLERRASGLQEESVAPTANTISDQQKVSECKYTLMRRIGQGVFGEVYLGTLKTNPKGKQFALKKVSKHHPKYKKMNVLREINAGKHLSHPAIIKFEESFETSSSIYLVMEYFASDDIYTILEDRDFRPFSEIEARHIFKQLISALSYSHEKGVAHRDIKLENILMDKRKNIRLIDFGLCDFVLDAANKTKVSIDSVGSPAYIAPEILIGRPYDACQADIWSCGIVLYALLFGRFPFSPTHYQLLLDGHSLDAEFPEYEVSDSLKELLLGMLTLYPTARMNMDDVLRHPWMSSMDIDLAN